MGKSVFSISIFLFLFLFIIVFSIDSVNSSSCPVDLSYVQTYPWDRSSCLDPNGKFCCATLLSLIGMGLAAHLRETSLFQFPNETASAFCLSELQGRLATLSINPSVVPTCFPNATQFASNTSFCAGIVTIEDWKKLVGPTSALDPACKNFSGFSQCSSCVEAGYSVNAKLLSIQPNAFILLCYMLLVFLMILRMKPLLLAYYACRFLAQRQRINPAITEQSN